MLASAEQQVARLGAVGAAHVWALLAAAVRRHLVRQKGVKLQQPQPHRERLEQRCRERAVPRHAAAAVQCLSSRRSRKSDHEISKRRPRIAHARRQRARAARAALGAQVC